MRPSRRDVLLGLAGALAAPRLARAMGPGSSEVHVAELDLGAGTISRPDAWKVLVAEVESTTSVECDAAPARVSPSSAELFRHPMSVLLGTGAFSLPDDTGLEQLQRYLSYGGFLLVDDTTGADRSGFDASVRRLCEALFPTHPLSPLPRDHSIYRSFFLIDRPVGRLAREVYLEGITLGGVAEGAQGHAHVPLVYCRNDLSGALDRAPDGRFRNACTPGGENQRREALKLAINLVIYGLTSDYKKDQAHVKALIEEGRLMFDSPEAAE